jgi:hypothetical protein
LLVSGLLLPWLQSSQSLAAGFGNLAGVVSDSKGIPLMGATVVVMGPTSFSTEAAAQGIERMVTDARGRFTLAHLVPGWYSLKVSSPTRLPVMRNGVRVDAGSTVIATFVLTDVFAPIRFQVPNHSVSSWGDDWKWVLRTSSTTRPILRFHPVTQTAPADAPRTKAPLPRSERIVGVLPGSTPRDPLAQDFGMASVFAYLQPVASDSDVLVAGAFAPYGGNVGTLGTMLMRNQLKGEPQQFGLVVHQFGLLPGAMGAGALLPTAKAMTASYAETRLITPKATITAGMDINYLNAVDNVLVAQPHVNLEYQVTAQTMLSAKFGSVRADGTNSLMERLGMLNAFPQITERDGHLAVEQVNHTEASLNHRVGRTGRVQAAAYHDGVRNAAVWGLGTSAYGAFAGNALPSPVAKGVVINGGNFQSSGFRAVFAQTFGSHVEVLGGYTSGQALSAAGYTANGSLRYAPDMLRPRQTNAFLGKVTADVPGTHTRISTSYEWVSADRVTLVDPAGQASVGVQPYLGLEIRQPIPTPNFLPVHIDAVADFQNLLSQGYVPAGEGNTKPVVLTSGYRYIRGGFSVQF